MRLTVKAPKKLKMYSIGSSTWWHCRRHNSGAEIGGHVVCRNHTNDDAGFALSLSTFCMTTEPTHRPERLPQASRQNCRDMALHAPPPSSRTIGSSLAGQYCVQWTVPDLQGRLAGSTECFTITMGTVGVIFNALQHGTTSESARREGTMACDQCCCLCRVGHRMGQFRV